MKKLVLLVLCCIILAACATATLPSNATEAEKQAALCKDAQFGVNLATVALEKQLSTSEKAYWDSYLAGARLAFDTYCPKQ